MPIIADFCPAGQPYNTEKDLAPVEGVLSNIISGANILPSVCFPGLTKAEHDWAFSRLAHQELSRFQKGKHPFFAAWKAAVEIGQSVEAQVKASDTRVAPAVDHDFTTDETLTGLRVSHVRSVPSSAPGSIDPAEIDLVWHEAARTSFDAVKKKLSPQFRKMRSVIDGEKTGAEEATALADVVSMARGLQVNLDLVEQMLTECDDPACSTPEGCLRQYLKAQGCDAVGVSATKVRDAILAHRASGKVLYTDEDLTAKGWSRVVLDAMPTGIGPFGFLPSGVVNSAGLAEGTTTTYPEFVIAHHEQEITRKTGLLSDLQNKRASLVRRGKSTIEVDAEIAAVEAEIDAHGAAIDAAGA